MLAVTSPINVSLMMQDAREGRSTSEDRAVEYVIRTVESNLKTWARENKDRSPHDKLVIEVSTGGRGYLTPKVETEVREAFIFCGWISVRLFKRPGSDMIYMELTG